MHVLSLDIHVLKNDSQIFQSTLDTTKASSAFTYMYTLTLDMNTQVTQAYIHGLKRWGAKLIEKSY